jgi:hypothetical protein
MRSLGYPQQDTGKGKSGLFLPPYRKSARKQGSVKCSAMPAAEEMMMDKSPERG